MLNYSSKLKSRARNLRSHLTDSEQYLWSRLRRKQLLGIQFYRQKPLGHYVVDFYAPRAKLVIEVDGSQHHNIENLKMDQKRDAYLMQQELMVLRFNNTQVLKELDSVVEKIYSVLKERL